MPELEPYRNTPTPPLSHATLLLVVITTIAFTVVWSSTGNADAAAAVAVGLLSLRPTDPPSEPH